MIAQIQSPFTDPEFCVFKEVLIDLVGKENAEDHLGLVCNIALKYATGPLRDSDAFSDGCLGLLEAIETYDEDKGTAFSTWATILIERSIVEEYRRRERQVRIPVVRMSELPLAGETILVDEERTLEELVEYLPVMLEPHPNDSKWDKRNKRILKHRYLEEQSYAEIGKRMKITPQAVFLAEKRGLNLLRSRFQNLLKDWE